MEKTYMLPKDQVFVSRSAEQSGKVVTPSPQELIRQQSNPHLSMWFSLARPVMNHLAPNNHKPIQIRPNLA